jgi:hypothetical protein
MIITNEFDVDKPIDKVWAFFDDVPAVARCLPGANLDEDLGDDQYKGTVGIRMGPVKMEFAGLVKIVEKDEQAKRLVIDGEGSDQRGRGQAKMLVTAKLTQSATGTKVSMDQDIQLSGAAAQYGRGMIADVSAVLMGQFANNMQATIEAVERGESPAEVGGAPAGAFGIAMKAMWMALSRVARRFFMPYRPAAN